LLIEKTKGPIELKPGRRTPMPINKNIIIKPKLIHLQGVLIKWTELIKLYSAEVQEDPPFWSTERANVGILAAAAWMTGGLSLEEYDAEKLKGRKRKKGRVDLWIRTANRKEFIFEAKQAWIRVGPETKVADVCEEITESLLDAVKDVRRIDCENECRVGTLFAIPRVSTEMTMKDALAIFNRAMKRTEADLKVPVMISTPAKWKNDKRHIYPGVALLGKKC
jgi:hypothetical protein